MSYEEYSIELSKHYESYFGKITSEYNFELGNEYEVAICRALIDTLPDKHGICRGYIVDRRGEKAGDDIIIYDKDRFPTLRILKKNDFAQKQYIPFEAVYAYIEAKHSLELEGEGGQSLVKANSQVAAVKALVRETVDGEHALDPYVSVPLAFKWPEYSPKMRNPIYTAIVSRYVKYKGELLEDPSEIKGKIIEARPSSTYPPDLLIAGKDLVYVPAIQDRSEGLLSVKTPFIINGVSKLVPFTLPGTAFAVGILSLLAALDHVKLGRLPWDFILSKSLKIPVEPK